MSYLIKSAKVISKHSSHHNQIVDILIEKGRISKIGKRIESSNAKEVSSPNLHVSIGWFDIGTHIGEPGYEQRETISSIDRVASCGGFSGIAVFPKTKPVIQHKNHVLQIINASSNLTTDIVPIAAISQNCEGKELTEMIDLHQAGAVAFSDGLNSIRSQGLLERSLEYVKSFEGKIIHSPNSEDDETNWQMHEGTVSVSLGLPGNADDKEKSRVERDLNLVRYANSDMVFHGISSAKSLEVIKDSGMVKKVSVTIPYLNLVESDESLSQFDENFKVNPPLRDQANNEELLRFTRTKLVDAIVSNHVPLEVEKKEDAFPFSSFGASGLQTMFAALNGLLKSKLPLEVLIEKISVGPREILDLAVPELEVGEKANLTLFDPEMEWDLNGTTNQSLSTNNPYFGKSLKGKVIAVFNNNKHFFAPY